MKASQSRGLLEAGQGWVYPDTCRAATYLLENEDRLAQTKLDKSLTWLAFPFLENAQALRARAGDRPTDSGRPSPTGTN